MYFIRYTHKINGSVDRLRRSDNRLSNVLTTTSTINRFISQRNYLNRSRSHDIQHSIEFGPQINNSNLKKQWLINYLISLEQVWSILGFFFKIVWFASSKVKINYLSQHHTYIGLAKSRFHSPFGGPFHEALKILFWKLTSWLRIIC